MIEAVKPETLYLILPYKISQVAMLYARGSGISLSDAVRDIYRSETYRRLEREETKLWHYGPVALYEYFIENG